MDNLSSASTISTSRIAALDPGGTINEIHKRKTRTKTVVFDVGGTLYRVSRSLLEQHPDTMLARIASETWSSDETGDDYDSNHDGNHNDINDEMTKKINHSDTSSAGETKKNDDINIDIHADGSKNGSSNDHDTILFIKRNGERFQYCLDYMRDGENVVIPHTISKAALLQDLTYYGFQDIDPSIIFIQGSLSMLETSHNHIQRVAAELAKEILDQQKVFDDHQKVIDDQQKVIDSLEMKQLCLILLKHCLRRHKRKAHTRFVITEKDEGKLLYSRAQKLNSCPKYLLQFTEHLERIGLKLKQTLVYGNSVEIYLDFL